MTFTSVQADEAAKSVRNERRRQQDKRRMAFRRAIEDYREAQAMREQLGEYPEWLAGNHQGLPRPAL